MNIPLTAELLRSFDPFWLTLCRYVVASVALGTAVALTARHGASALADSRWRASPRWAAAWRRSWCCSPAGCC
jgi:hypothetical protein